MLVLFGFSASVLGDLIGGSLADDKEGISDFFTTVAVLAEGLVAGGRQEVDSAFLSDLDSLGVLEVVVLEPEVLLLLEACTLLCGFSKGT